MTAAGGKPLLFGTDGVRDKAGQGYLRPESIVRLVAATEAALARRDRFPTDFPPRAERQAVVIARDTRASGEGLAREIAAAFARFGRPVHDAGVLPTPGAAFLASAWRDVVLGIVISASHNPAEDNGIKFLAPTGAKISPEFEREASDEYWANARPAEAARPGRVADRAAEARERYVRRLVEIPRKPGRLRGRKVALDLANGATFAVAPEVFRRLGMQVVAMGASPDGININLGCGALYPEGLAKLVLESRADAGFCFDGDGDRMIPVTRRGSILDGDHVLYLAGKHFARTGRLREPVVVATSMSNVGLEVALRAEGLGLLRTDVGDRNVYLAMVERRLPVGGEQSGHIIFLEDALTGDGILAALKLLDVLEGDALDLDHEAAPMRRYPQLLRNVRVPEKVPFDRLPLVGEAVRAAEARLHGEGRVVLRYSGTEPLARVMIEGPDQATVETLVSSVCDAIRESLPGSA